MQFDEFKQKAARISNDPLTRIPDHIKPLVDDEKNRINCHCHIFNEKTVPKALFNMKMPYRKRTVAKIIKTLHKFNGRSNDDWASNYAYFVALFAKSTKEISDELISYYPENTLFTPLMMDMHNRSASDKRKNAEYYIQTQGEDLEDLIHEGYKFLPFLPIDPTFADKTNPDLDVFDVFIKGFNGDYGFMPYGVKIYPTLGYLPGHPKLMEIFKVCQEKNIPVTTHCSRGMVHGYKKKLKNIQGWKIGKDGQLTDKPESRWFWNGSAYANYFNHPKNWEPVLEAYPKLKLNFGHFGGAKQWHKLLKGKNNTWVSRIIELMNKYENVYADISFTDSDVELFELIRSRFERTKTVRERMLYGYDFYMVVVEGHYGGIKANFESAMGDEMIYQIANINTRRFLLPATESSNNAVSDKDIALEQVLKS